MKADLHVHSYHSGHARYFRWLHARDCYSSPEAIYQVAKARGMDLVCLTDHDSIDGCREFLDRHPDAADFIVGEEIECLVPDAPGLRVHLGAIGLSERVHREVQRLRPNVFEAAAYLRREDVFCVFNHLFMFFRDQTPIEQYVRRALSLTPGLETHNGAMLAAHNTFVADLAAAYRAEGQSIVAVGGSDAHTLQWVGTAYTEAPGQTREEFLSSLRQGRTETGGLHGGEGRLLAEVYGVILKHWRTLLGFERDDLSTSVRLVSGVCSALLLPAQFVPGLLALSMKRGERRRIRRYRRAWSRLAVSAIGDARPSAI
jgi:predicted metal-dependent phosphoesterase TrpH